MRLRPKMPLDDLEKRFAVAWPPEDWQHERILVAASGGSDSTALLCWLARAGDPQRLTVGHLHHGLRSEADEDALFVRELAKQYQLAFAEGRADVAGLANLAGDGIEAAAREARYAWLTKTAREIGARYVVTAHTADDQVETILQRILRGTGIAGLVGIPRVRLLADGISLMRPWLDFHRAELQDYLHLLNQSWREDASNQSRAMTRNRLRHELLPLLEREYNADIRAALLRLVSLADDARKIIDRRVDELWSELGLEDRSWPTEAVTLPLAELSKLPNEERVELLIRLWQRANWPLQSMTRAHWQQLQALWLGPDLTLNLPGNVLAKKTTAGVELRRLG
jgi:tRNA(Ile)-lysidine synthase